MTMIRFCLAMISLGLSHCAWADAPVGVEEVLVTGEHPGPGMWKVSRGEHALWILGTHAPLPRQMTWRSQEVEWVMTEAQEVLGPYLAAFTLEGVDTEQIKTTKLRRVLSRKQYSQWLALKTKYIGPNEAIENTLPVAAALVLRSAAFARVGLTNADPVWREMYALAQRYDVPVNTEHQVTKVIGPEDMRDAKSASRAGVDYLVNTIGTLENDLLAARTRANAWATGDIGALERDAQADQTSADLYASSWPFLQDEELRQLLVETDRMWLLAADSALHRNRTTLAMLPIFMLLRKDGVLAKLRASGYVVDAPVY